MSAITSWQTNVTLLIDCRTWTNSPAWWHKGRFHVSIQVSVCQLPQYHTYTFHIKLKKCFLPFCYRIKISASLPAFYHFSAIWIDSPNRPVTLFISCLSQLQSYIRIRTYTLAGDHSQRFMLAVYIRTVESAPSGNVLTLPSSSSSMLLCRHHLLWYPPTRPCNAVWMSRERRRESSSSRRRRTRGKRVANEVYWVCNDLCVFVFQLLPSEWMNDWRREKWMDECGLFRLQIGFFFSFLCMVFLVYAFDGYNFDSSQLCPFVVHHWCLLFSSRPVSL